ncbi:MAG: xanthine dehydrogenase accessory protein XdhC [Pseudomonadota bacterium]
MSLTLTDLQIVQDAGEPWVLVTLVRTRGSTPRELGANIAVTPSRIVGTIGGGELEFQAVHAARRLLNDPAAVPASDHFVLGARLGQCCGGQATLWFERGGDWRDLLSQCEDPAEPAMAIGRAGDQGRLLVSASRAVGGLEVPETVVREARARLAGGLASPTWLADGEHEFFLEPRRPQDFNIWLFGAGHVGSRVARVLATLPAKVVWVDERPDMLLSFGAGNVELRLAKAPELEVWNAPAGAYFCVMTHSHALDAEVCGNILERNDFAYAGLIGSTAKRLSFEKRFRNWELEAAAIERLQCPIAGLEEVGELHKDPGVIAVGLARELLAVRARRAAARPVSEPAHQEPG